MSVLEDKFNENQNSKFIAKDLDSLKADGYALLKNFINAHVTNQVPRLERLKQTYLGFNHGINNREKRDTELADYRATHDFAKYITDFITGYVAGNAVTYTHEDKSADDELKVFNDVNDIESHDFNMIEDCSIYGRAYELVYRTDEDVDKVVQVSPFNAFIIYDSSLEQNELAGVIHFADTNEKGEEVRNITLYTEDDVISLVAEGEDITQTEEKPHFYSAIQLNGWMNNRFGTGDFEHVLDLFDLYDIAQSDTANYMTDLNDALLKIEGDVKLDVDEARKMKEARMILIKPKVDAQGGTSPVNADYIYKKYDVQGVEAYKDRIKQDIHMLTYTPNSADDSFAGVQSGEAMKYKMTALEQVRAKKERHFKKALKKRYGLVGTILGIQNRVDDLRALQIEFTPNIPKTRLELVNLFNSLGGTLSERTKLGLLDFIDDPDTEMKQIADEQTAAREVNETDEYEANTDGTTDEV